ncbi:START-like domain-containing protein [Gaoshiqia sp. Z1-71]|uniref:START-like domain-containing protein n=1 Tax=Gaoshiqia hydrogeniformans TaxID=3290090 RepID=UPI003BF80D4B
MASKSKIQLEFPINCSPAVLYNRLSSASGLAEWFADDVYVKGKIFTFIWEGSEQRAEMVQNKDSKSVRFKWLDDDDSDAYFEFTINKEELTGDVSLMVIDFAEEGEEDEAIDLWNTQIADLKRILGC